MLLGDCGENQVDGGEIECLAPDHSFLIQQILNDFDAVPHLDLGLLRHRQHGPDQLAGLHIHERGDAFTRRFFELTTEACQGRPPG